ncbi:type II toxin-antitoxin system PemI/MazE family antitoxin [Pseudolactococcus reticulitermitis]|uniref:SpoVT-AbrB domain-containing protein n=1 Tax=Pseudolactococcus reticulitermitis TaxID=2025039 RepID=A0A224X4Y0_9LACT|nr:AbrB family transcriptional regulator [Lactococcus reticulitermitis]GAX47706.1 hypothetical protein RsY01_1307 [Lactococcus reticulitermitis]GHU38487.1 AbrB family transcriptional regulator [Bacilli bacterium]GHU43085.1 AbrB family transcriptional regulator [Bacilli bacterium]
MPTVKTRKVGNSTTVTIPQEIGVGIGEEFFVYKGIDGVIVLAPKVENPFLTDQDLHQEEVFNDVDFLATEIGE